MVGFEVEEAFVANLERVDDLVAIALSSFLHNSFRMLYPSKLSRRMS